MRIQHNIAALNSYRNLRANNDSVSKSLEKLSSGYRINRAGDDAAGLAISEKMRAQITGLNTAQKNAQDGISLVQTAEGALTEVHSMLNRMVELATQSSNGVYDDGVSRKNLQNELNQLRDEIDRISDATNFNGKNLLDGSLTEKTYVSMYQSTQSVAITGNFQASGNLKTALGGTAPSLNITYNNAQTAAQSSATITEGGAITVTLGSQEAATFDNETINKLINKAIDDRIEDLGTPATAAEKDKIAALGKLKDSFTGSVELKKAGVKAIDATGVKTLPDTETGNEALSLQIGDTNASFNKMEVDVDDMHAEALGLDKISVATQDAAGEAIVAIKAAIDSVSSTRGNLGAIQNRLDHTINNLSVTTENMTAAESRVRDVDMAEEMMTYTKNNILVQSSQAMLAQANQIPQGVLQLLQ